MQTIGERLEEARKRKGISIREAAEATKIRGDYLQQFENNRFEIDLPEIYTRGFLRTYAHFLKLPTEKILTDYRSLGLGETKPRTPSREIYGRMDLSIASANSTRKDEEAISSDSAPVAGEASPRKFAKIGTSLPEGTYVDARVIVKIALIVGAVLLVGLLVWGIAAMTRGGPSKAATATAQPTAEPKITLVALDTVHVQVEKADRTVLFKGQMVRGETREFPPVFINVWATAREVIEFEYKGKRYATGQTGRDWVGFDPSVIKSP